MKFIHYFYPTTEVPSTVSHYWLRQVKCDYITWRLALGSQRVNASNHSVNNRIDSSVYWEVCPTMTLPTFYSFKKLVKNKPIYLQRTGNWWAGFLSWYHFLSLRSRITKNPSLPKYPLTFLKSDQRVPSVQNQMFLTFPAPIQ